MSMWALPTALAMLSADAVRLRQVVRSFVTFSIRLGALVLVSAALVFSSQPTLAHLAQFTQQGPKLVGSVGSPGANQGQSVALSADGNTAVLGGPGDNSQTGAAWVFVRSSTTVAHDFNGDGKSDILWRHISGGVFISMLNGTQVTTSASMGGDLNWTPFAEPRPGILTGAKASLPTATPSPTSSGVTPAVPGDVADEWRHDQFQKWIWRSRHHVDAHRVAVSAALVARTAIAGDPRAG